MHPLHITINERAQLEGDFCSADHNNNTGLQSAPRACKLNHVNDMPLSWQHPTAINIHLCKELSIVSIKRESIFASFIINGWSARWVHACELWRVKYKKNKTST